MTAADRRILNMWAVLAAGVLVSGCDDGAGPKSDADPATHTHAAPIVVLAAAIVSSPVPSGPGTGGGAPTSSPTSAPTMVYVSLPPGAIPTDAVPTAARAQIADPRTGGAATAVMVDGGFDPVSLAANAGDTLQIEIFSAGSEATTGQVFYAMVPLTTRPQPPVVVRADPPPQKRDVPLNATLLIVFSDPISGTTLTKGAVQLFQGSTPIAGTLTFVDSAHTALQFLPTDSLAPATNYRLVVTPGVEDVIGDSLAVTVTIPFTTSGGVGVAMVSAGAAFACGLTSAGAAYCWGDENNGPDALGAGPTNGSDTPLAVLGGLTFTTVSAGFSSACGLTTAGAAYCWGYNGDGVGDSLGGGQLGNGTKTDSDMPVPVSGGLTFATVSAGYVSACGVTTTGAAYCWGDNFRGELGNGTTTASTTPVAVSGGLTFATVSAGGLLACGVTTGGAEYCWGGESGNFFDNVVPVAISGGLRFATVSAGSDFACGVTTTGAAYCWGYAALGNDTTTWSLTPVAVSGGLTFATVSASGWGFAFACGVTTAGAAYCWGDNTYGQLGNGTTTYSPVPVAVSGGLTFATVSAGQISTCGVTTAGAAYCWGNNTWGGLGNGTTIGSLVPVPVMAFTSATAPALSRRAAAASQRMPAQERASDLDRRP